MDLGSQSAPAFGDPAADLLYSRELQALRSLLVVRLVILLIMAPMAWVLGSSTFDAVLTSSMLVLYAAWLAASRWFIAHERRLTTVGLTGVVLDVAMLGSLPFIWFLAMSGEGTVAVGVTLKTSVTVIAVLLIAINGLALRPLYPALMTVGAVLVHLVLIGLALNSADTTFTTSYFTDYTTDQVAVGRVATRLIVVVLVGIILTLLARAARAMVLEAATLEKANVQLGRYFSPNLVPRLLDSPELFAVGGRRLDVSFVFTDLQGFTTLVETLEPNVAVPLINRYLNELVEVAFRHEGTVDKIVGDAVHVIFGAPTDQPDHAARAVRCALEMDEVAERLRVLVAPEIQLGVTRIGVNSGLAVVGNFGGDALFDYTAHGDAINTAARLEGANKVFGTRICVSVNTVERIDQFVGRPLGSLQLRGRAHPLEAFEALPVDEGVSERVALYLRAYSSLAEGAMATAAEQFTKLSARYPDDQVVAFYNTRIGAGERGTVIEVGG
jgi:class 3 adenylate cyclase